MNYNQHRVGKNIRFLRRRMNMSINKLARAVSITPSFLGLVERGERGLRIENLCKLSSVFGITLDDLVFNDFMDETKNSAREDDNAVFDRQLEAITRGASEYRKRLILNVVRDIMGYYEGTSADNAEETGAANAKEIEY